MDEKRRGTRGCQGATDLPVGSIPLSGKGGGSSMTVVIGTRDVVLTVWRQHDHPGCPDHGRWIESDDLRVGRDEACAMVKTLIALGIG